MAERGRRWLGRSALIGASSLVAFLVAELALRAGGIAPPRWAHPWHIETDDKRLGLDLYPDDPRDAFPLDLREEGVRRRYRERGLAEVDARWERTPDAVPFVYTAELCRGEAIASLPEGAARVVAIGDSFTEGQGVCEEDTYAARLDRALDGSAQVLNCGRRGHDFPALHALFTRNLALEPDVVVYAMILNDPEQSAAFHARQAYIDDWILDRGRMLLEDDPAPPPWSSRLVELIADRVEGMRVASETTRWYREMVEAPNGAGWAATLEHIAAMDAAMRERGGALVVVLWPLFVGLDGEYPFEATHRTIGRALEARSITFHDTLPAFRGRDPAALWVHPSDRHPNEAAHAIFARELEPMVRAAIVQTRQTR
jgi:hypothetical protein